jgi:hypothetical protein
MRAFDDIRYRDDLADALLAVDTQVASQCGSVSHAVQERLVTCPCMHRIDEYVAPLIDAVTASLKDASISLLMMHD